MERRWGRLVAAVLAVGLAVHASGSGGPPPVPDYVTAAALLPVDQQALAAGNLGILKGAAPPAVLYLDWRILNRLGVDAVTTKALATPCCNALSDNPGNDWIETRKAIPGASTDLYWVSTEREGPNYTSIPTCFNDALVNAAKTLKDRIARYGAASPAVRAWLDAQDAVFAACSKAGQTLPPLPADAPDWLRADHAYQQAALALYDSRYDDAERDFAAIARDRGSPWQPMALYLRARVAQHAAIDRGDPALFARAHAAIAELDGTPAGTYGKAETERMKQVLEYHEHPATLLAQLDKALNQTAPAADIAVKFKDYQSLSASASQHAEAADWIATIQSKDRAAGLAHAAAQWQARHGSAWLVAALSLAMPGDAGVGALTDAAARLSPTDPAWLSVQYQTLRLRFGRESPGDARTRVDAILARRDLTISDRNVFLAIRAQLAPTLEDFAAQALREPYCSDPNAACGSWPSGDGLLGKLDGQYVGLGGDARAVIDRLPLSQRLALARIPALPREIRLDISLTNYVRAVLLQNDAAIDEIARQLTDLLPQVRGDWTSVTATPSGPAKRFAEIFVMAKIPSLRTDLADYSRPEGAEPSFSGYWVNWLVPQSGAPAKAASFPPASAYMPDDYWDGGDANADANKQDADLPCAGKCGLGTFPLAAPPFAVPLSAQALRERTYYRTDRGEMVAATGTHSLWIEALDYVTAHPRDPRAGEMLYRLNRVARWGGGGAKDHLSRRAFQLLHSRYPASEWARKTPFFYD